MGKFQKLEALIESRECENMITHLENENNLREWENNPLLALYMKTHTASADVTAGIEELSANILDIKRPNTIGRSLVRSFSTTNVNGIKIRSPKKGKTVKTSHGKISIESHGARNDFLELKPEMEIEASEEWDLAYLESVEWNVMQQQTQEIMATLREYESQYLIDQITGIATADSAGLVTLGSTAKLTPDMLIQAWGNIIKQNGSPNTLVLNPDQIVDLLSNTEMKNQLILGQFANYQAGMVGMFLGMQLYVSTQVPENQAYAFDKNRYCWAIWRRDRLITPYSPRVHVNGIQASSYLGSIIADPTVCTPIRAA